MPGPQPPFSLNQDPDQNKENISFVSAEAYGVDVRFISVLQLAKISKKMSTILTGSRNPGSKIRKGFYPFCGVEIIPPKKKPEVSYIIP